MKDQEIIDRHLPYRGACIFCGHPDARHRLFDAIKERYQAGDRVEDLAYDYRLAIELIEAVLRLK